MIDRHDADPDTQRFPSAGIPYNPDADPARASSQPFEVMQFLPTEAAQEPEAGQPLSTAADAGAVQSDGGQGQSLQDRFAALRALGDRIDSAALEAAGFKVVDVRSPGHEAVRPFTILSGVLSIRDFDIAEERIVASLSPHDRQAMAYERYADDRIQNRLRPTGKFAGQLIHGQVVILPFDPEIAGRHNAASRRQLDAMSAEEIAAIEGATALYTGTLKRSHGVVGRIELQTTYHKRVGTALSLMINKAHGYTIRSLGKPEFGDVEEVMHQQDMDSIRYALNVASFALRHAYKAGLPGAATTDQGEQ